VVNHDCRKSKTDGGATVFSFFYIILFCWEVVFDSENI
jgi:hypothetical protein